MDEVTSDSFRLEITGWLERASGTPVDRATLASLLIEADSTVFSHVEDIHAKTVRTDIRVSAYDLACWLICNWWRLRWEPEGTGTDWRLSHEIAGIGGGYAWPPLTFISDGTNVLVRSTRSQPKTYEPLRFLCDAYVSVPASRFEQAIDQFADQVLARLSSLRLNSELATLRQELLEERKDAGIAKVRKLEAMMGFDAGEAPTTLLSGVIDQARVTGEDAIGELAAASQKSVLNDLTTIRRCLETTRTSIEITGLDDTISAIRAQQSSSVAAWQKAHRAADMVREAWNLRKGPLSNEILVEPLGLPATALTTELTTVAPIPTGYRNGQSDARMPIAFHSRYEAGRRFELMRLVGDWLVAPLGDRLLPATRAKTYRQKFQRAFAQELLCPWADLDELFGSHEPDDDDIEDAARHFNVSPLLVKTTLVNKGRLSRDQIES